LNAAQRSEVILYLAQCTAVAWQEVGKFIVSGQHVRGVEAGEQQYAWLWPVRLRGSCLEVLARQVFFSINR